jgi:hypothetical protein
MKLALRPTRNLVLGGILKLCAEVAERLSSSASISSTAQQRDGRENWTNIETNVHPYVAGHPIWRDVANTFDHNKVHSDVEALRVS